MKLCTCCVELVFVKRKTVYFSFLCNVLSNVTDRSVLAELIKSILRTKNMVAKKLVKTAAEEELVKDAEEAQLEDAEEARHEDAVGARLEDAEEALVKEIDMDHNKEIDILPVKEIDCLKEINNTCAKEARDLQIQEVDTEDVTEFDDSIDLTTLSRDLIAIFLQPVMEEDFTETDSFWGTADCQKALVCLLCRILLVLEKEHNLYFLKKITQVLFFNLIFLNNHFVI